MTYHIHGVSFKICWLNMSVKTPISLAEKNALIDNVACGAICVFGNVRLNELLLLFIALLTL